MGPPDQCQHAASIITDLLQSIRAREEGGQGVSRVRQADDFDVDEGDDVKTPGMCCVFIYRALQVQVQVCRPVVEGEVEVRGTGVLLEER